MRTNEEQTKKIIELRDEYNKKLARRKRNLLLIIPSVALISIIVVISLFPFLNTTTESEISPIDRIIEKQNSAEKSLNDKSEFDGYSTSNSDKESVVAIVSDDESSLTELGSVSFESTQISKAEIDESNSSEIKESTSTEPQYPICETTIPAIESNYETTIATSVNYETTTPTINTTFIETTIVSAMPTETMTVEIATTAIKSIDETTTQNSDNVESTIVSDFNVEVNNNTYVSYSFEYTPSSIIGEYVSSDEIQIEGLDEKFGFYNVAKVPASYFVLASNKETSFILYSEFSNHDAKEFIDDLCVINHLQSAFAFSEESINTSDLMDYIKCYTSNTEYKGKIKTGSATTISGAKSGLSQTYQLEFVIEESGKCIIKALSKNGEYAFAETSFSISVSNTTPPQLTPIVFTFDIDGTKYKGYSPEATPSVITGDYIMNGIAQCDGFQMKLDLYQILKVPTTYYVLAFDGQNYYILYSQIATYDSKEFLEDLFVLDYLNRATILTDGIEASDLIDYVKCHLSNTPFEGKLKTGKIETTYGMRSGLAQTYRLNFEIEEDGTIVVTALSKEGTYAFATTKFNVYDTLNIPDNEIVFPFEIDGISYKYCSLEYTTSSVQGKYLTSKIAYFYGEETKLELYQIVDVPISYFILAKGEKENYILYAENSKHVAKDFLEELYVINHLKSATVTSKEGITKDDLISYIKGYISSTPIEKFKTGKALTMSGAKSGLSQMYMLEIEILEDGTCTLNALSKDGKYTFAMSKFKIYFGENILTK